MYEPHYIPSLEQIEEMERQQSQALEALEYVISAEGSRAVKCQRCSHDIPIAGKLSSSKKARVVQLQTRQRFQENHPDICKKEDLEETKHQLAKLQEEEAKVQSGRLPLNSSRITHYKYYCPKLL